MVSSVCESTFSVCESTVQSTTSVFQRFPAFSSAATLLRCCKCYAATLRLELLWVPFVRVLKNILGLKLSTDSTSAETKFKTNMFLIRKKNYSFCYIAKDVEAPDKVVPDAADAPREIGGGTGRRPGNLLGSSNGRSNAL